MQTLQPAQPLKDLRDRIDEAIEIAGEQPGTVLMTKRFTSITQPTAANGLQFFRVTGNDHKLAG
jgi:hypothetical protein